MPLPKITTAEYELKLPSSGKTIKYRPFLVKEEKILILSLESEDRKQITSAVKQVLKECVLTKGITIGQLPSFDIEYLFLNVRAKSVGETIDLVVTCGDDGTTEVPVTVPIDEIKVTKSDDHSQDIELSDGYTVRMKYPSLDEFIDENFNFDGQASDNSFEIIASCIDMVFSEDEAWEAKDCTKKELTQFVEQLNSAQFKEIEKFFDTMPQLSHDIEVENPKTKVKSTVKLEGLASFFG